MTTLVCKCCGEEKDISEFYQDKRSKTGKMRQPCKECIRKQGKEKRDEYKSQEKITPETKACSTCGRTLPASCFYKRDDSPDGLRHECKECARESSHRVYTNNRGNVLDRTRKYNNGHKEERLLTKKIRYWKDPDKSRAVARSYYNTEQHKTTNKAWRYDNKDKLKHYRDTYREKYPDRLKLKAAKWRKRNRDKDCYYSSSRRARLKCATPLWADQDTIKSFYTEAQYFNCEVDHIIPLVHPLVCGLHCEFNMQILTRSDNASKNNKFEICEHEIPEWFED